MVAFPPGGGADVFARIIAKGLETELAQPVIPINKPGAGSVIGSNYVKNARADNGETRQDWTMAEMIYGFDETLSFLSRSLTLRPGDMLSSGTGAGVALESGVDGGHWLKPGDVMEVRLDGLAPLRNVVGAW